MREKTSTLIALGQKLEAKYQPTLSKQQERNAKMHALIREIQRLSSTVEQRYTSDMDSRTFLTKWIPDFDYFFTMHALTRVKETLEHAASRSILNKIIE